MKHRTILEFVAALLLFLPLGLIWCIAVAAWGLIDLFINPNHKPMQDCCFQNKHENGRS